jgi:hypothetical protein
MGSSCVAQAGLELLGSSDSASASVVARTTSMPSALKYFQSSVASAVLEPANMEDQLYFMSVLLPNKYFFVWMHHILFSYSAVDGRWAVSTFALLRIMLP